MPKHLIEEDFIGKNGFKQIKIGGNYINVDNVDDGILEMLGNGSVDLKIINNKLQITTSVPTFSKVEW